MKVYFRNSNGKKILIGTVDNDKQAMKTIKSFCDEREFKIYYTRMWVDKDIPYRTWVDVGSHTEFFIIDKTK